jgi:hypothetical protein
MGIVEMTDPQPKERDNLTSFPPLTDEEAEDLREMYRINRAGLFASDEAAALWFRGEKTW